MDSLTEQAKNYLDSCRGKWKEVAINTGLDIQWIYKFMSDGIVDPGVSKIEKILQYRDAA